MSTIPKATKALKECGLQAILLIKIDGHKFKLDSFLGDYTDMLAIGMLLDLPFPKLADETCAVPIGLFKEASKAENSGAVLTNGLIVAVKQDWLRDHDW